MGGRIVPNASFDWAVQIGPEVTGNLGGLIWADTATFLVQPQNPNRTYVTYSNDGGANWTDVPNDVYYEISGGQHIEWRLAPGDNGVKFVMGTTFPS